MLDPLERAKKLEEIYNRNPEALVNFLNLIKGQNNHYISNGLFTLLFELLVGEQNELEISTKVFVHSLMFYQNQKVDLAEQLLRRTMNYLTYKPNWE